jgi:hypothetical protein
MGIRIVNSPQNHSKKHRFKFWIAVFFLLLSLVSLFAFIEWFTFAKVLGVSLVVLLSIVLRWWLHISKLNAVSNPPTPMNANDWFDLYRNYPFLNHINKDIKHQLSAQIGLLLSNVVFVNESGQPLSRFEAIELSLYMVIKFWSDELTLKNAVFVPYDITLNLNEVNGEVWYYHSSLFGFLKVFKQSDWAVFCSEVSKQEFISVKRQEN